MSSIVKLIKVEPNSNNNKFYNMTDLGDGSFRAEWGRVGQKGQSQIYGMGQWDKKYREKTSKKGYRDVSELVTESKSSDLVPLKDPELDKLFNFLMTCSRQAIASNYVTESKDVTQIQVDEAQEILNELSKMVDDPQVDNINTMLTDLYSVIPRKMKRVKDHLFNDGDEVERLQQILSDEQDLLDVMAQSVTQNQTQIDSDQDKQDILEILGIEAWHVTSDEEIQKVKRMMGRDSGRFRRLFKVVNRQTQAKFDRWMDENGKHDRKELLWARESERELAQHHPVRSGPQADQRGHHRQDVRAGHLLLPAVQEVDRVHLIQGLLLGRGK